MSVNDLEANFRASDSGLAISGNSLICSFAKVMNKLLDNGHNVFELATVGRMMNMEMQQHHSGTQSLRAVYPNHANICFIARSPQGLLSPP
eukprot:323862_1